MSEFEIIQEDRKQLQCACQNKVFSMVVVPDIATGAAKVVEVYCVNCQKGVEVTDGVLGISKPDPTADSDSYTDRRGRKHHSLKCDPIHIGAEIKGIGGHKNN